MRLLGLGDNTVDTYVDIGEQYPGGNAVNVAVLARRLGAETAYLGCFGADEAGDLLRAALAAEGVETSRCRHRAGANARAFIGHDNGDRKFLKSEPGVRADYGFEDEDFAYTARFDLVHTSVFSGLDAELPRLRAAATSISYDFSERWTRDLLARTLPLINIPCLSAPRLSDDESEDLISFCRANGARLGLLTQGARGAIGWNETEARRQIPAPAEIVDTLGAGDAFISAFLVAHFGGKGLSEALSSGADFAGRICGQKGAFGRGAIWRGGRPDIAQG